MNINKFKSTHLDALVTKIEEILKNFTTQNILTNFQKTKVDSRWS